MIYFFQINVFIFICGGRGECKNSIISFTFAFAFETYFSSNDDNSLRNCSANGVVFILRKSVSATYKAIYLKTKKKNFNNQKENKNKKFTKHKHLVIPKHHNTKHNDKYRQLYCIFCYKIVKNYIFLKNFVKKTIPLSTSKLFLNTNVVHCSKSVIASRLLHTNRSTTASAETRHTSV